AAHRLMFLVAGDGKAAALRQVLEPRDGEDPLPAARVRGGDAEVTWMIDEAAASELSKTETVTSWPGVGGWGWWVMSREAEAKAIGNRLCPRSEARGESPCRRSLRKREVGTKASLSPTSGGSRNTSAGW